MKLSIYLMFVIVLASCATELTPEEIEKLRNLDYGTYPSDYDALIREHLAIKTKRAIINEPAKDENNEFKISYLFEPKKDYWFEGGYARVNGYSVCANIPIVRAFGDEMLVTWIFKIREGKVERYSWDLMSVGNECNHLIKRAWN